MTREEAIEALSSEKEARILYIDRKPTICYSAKRIRALEMAIKALEQQHCEDAISRHAAVLSKIETVCFSEEWFKFRIDHGSNGVIDYLINYIKQLPPVQQKMGQWIESHIPESTLCECSVCGFSCGAYSFNFCPNCGAKMKGARNET